jgi:chromosome segregation ATPase
VNLKENMWFLEKKELTDQIKELEGKLAAAEAVNTDLRHKNNMLEHSIRQIRLKSKEDKEPLEKEPDIPIPQRRPKSNKPQISK